ncbi:MAG TPA: hypothetical protein VFS21_09165 [Roseiflexaceae bacterium]|nr:hypothetical protein [Roseiflexaceae bacterium]
MSQQEYDQQIYQLRKRADDAELRTAQIHGTLLSAHGRLFTLQDAIWDHLVALSFGVDAPSAEQIAEANERLWDAWRKTIQQGKE